MSLPWEGGWTRLFYDSILAQIIVTVFFIHLMKVNSFIGKGETPEKNPTVHENGNPVLELNHTNIKKERC